MEDFLKEMGLTGTEARVYIALLEIGPSTVLDISRHTKLHRTIIYESIDRLANKGLLSQSSLNGKKVLAAASPERFRTMIEEKSRQLDEILPKLKELTCHSNPCHTQIYVGKEGIKTAFEEILAEKPAEILGLGSGGENYEKITSTLNNFHQKRIAQKISVRGLFRTDPASVARSLMLSKLPLTKIRYLPEHISAPAVMHIYANKVTLISTEKDPCATLIENPLLATSFKQYFEWMWSISKENP